MALRPHADDIDTKQLLSHELFDDKGELWLPDGEASLKNALKVEASGRTSAQDIDIAFLYGSATLWLVPWPKNGNVQSHLDLHRKFVYGYLETSDMHVVFGRYYPNSIKTSARKIEVVVQVV